MNIIAIKVSTDWKRIQWKFHLHPLYKSSLMHIVQWDKIRIKDYYSNKNDPNS